VSDETTPATAPVAPAAPPVQLGCEKHGIITDAALNLRFAMPDGSQVQYLYCLHCLNDVLLSLQKAGTLATVQILTPAPADEVPADGPPAVPDGAAALAALVAASAKQ
jgi:hypothetical protein